MGREPSRRGSLFQYYDISIPERLVSGYKDRLSRAESFLHFVILRVLSADADFPSYRTVPFGREDIYPPSSRMLEESAAWYHYRLLRLSELEVHIIGLSGPDVFRLLSGELEVGLELAFPHFRIHFADNGQEFLFLPFEYGFKSGRYPVYIVFVYQGLYLVARQIVYLSYPCAGSYGLAEYGIQEPEFPVDRSLDGAPSP